MSNTGFYEDAPFKIIQEGRQITITLEKLPNNKAKISWTLPLNISDCSKPPRDYNGIVIVLDNTPIKLTQTPIDGEIYSGDLTASRNLHAGDKISTGLVLAALYDDKTTTSIIISDVESGIPYYIAGFAVDNVYRHHSEGVHTYSLPYGNDSTTPDTNGYQVVTLNTQLVNNTGLQLNTNYNLDISQDGNPAITYVVSGDNSQTYNDLLNEFNRLFALQLNPILSPITPNINNYYIDIINEKAYQWDGTTHNTILDILFSDHDPKQPNLGSYWVNNIAQLHKWNGNSWDQLQYIKHDHPINQLKCTDVWFDGVDGYRWDGNIWIKQPTYLIDYDPNFVSVKCGTYWFDSANNTLNEWIPNNASCQLPSGAPSGNWQPSAAILWSYDPNQLIDGVYWYDTTNNILLIRSNNTWQNVFVNIVDNLPSVAADNAIFYEKYTNELYQYNYIDAVWTTLDSIIYSTDPTIHNVGDLWWDTFTDKLYKWDSITNSWIKIDEFYIEGADPSLPIDIKVGSLWYHNNTMKCWDGSKWNIIEYFFDSPIPQLIIGDYWYNTNNNTWNIWDGTQWNVFNVIYNDDSLTNLPIGYFWFDTTTNTLNINTGASWTTFGYSATPLTPNIGAYWYNTLLNQLYTWDGKQWVEHISDINVEFTDAGDFKFISSTLGSKSSISITRNNINDLFENLNISYTIQPAIKGTDGLSGVPMYMQLGVGTDGSADERRDIIEKVLINLGYPIVQVELNKEQLELCVSRAISNLRRLSGAGYSRAFFFLTLKPNIQQYTLTDISAGFNKIVNIFNIKRMVSAFLGTAGGQGVYGQMVLQHLYSMGTYDLISYHIISEYVELMERMFASNIQYVWNERTRSLSIMQNVWQDEYVLVDASIERTEQDILSDRYLADWCLNWATAEACQILSEIRGKYSSLPAAGGGINLNATELKARASDLFTICREEVENGIVTGQDEYGLGSQMVWG